MRYGMYVETNMEALPTVYIAAERDWIVRVASEAPRESDQVFLSDRVDGNEALDNTEGEAGKQSSLLRRAAGELSEYFRGERQDFTVPIRMEGTEFQRKVWDALRRIPYGETRTYGQIADEIGCPSGARAVGMACNRNPIMLIVPCHRVVGANGKLVGFAGGLGMKEALLKLEKSAQSVLCIVKEVE